MKRITVLTTLSIIFIFTSCKDNSKEIKNLKEENMLLNTEVSDFNKEKEITEKNKEIVMNFYQELFGDINFDAANKYIGDVYIQHNPEVADGKESLIEMVKVWLKDVPKRTINFHNVIAEDDLVFLHIIEIDKEGTRHSIMDVFRVTNGKISEHWDAFAKFKKGDTSKNENPLF